MMRRTVSRRGFSGSPPAKRLFPARSSSSASSGVFGRGAAGAPDASANAGPDELAIDNAPAASVPPAAASPPAMKFRLDVSRDMSVSLP
jgi:hypothetical protein